MPKHLVDLDRELTLAETSKEAQENLAQDQAATMDQEEEDRHILANVDQWAFDTFGADPYKDEFLF